MLGCVIIIIGQVRETLHHGTLCCAMLRCAALCLRQPGKLSTKQGRGSVQCATCVLVKQGVKHASLAPGATDGHLLPLQVLLSASYSLVPLYIGRALVQAASDVLFLVSGA
jgi:hypothetical protein